MSFFRRKLRSGPIVARLATANDRSQIVRLAYSAEHRFLTSGMNELDDLLAADPTALIEIDRRLVGALSFGWRAQPVAWIRTLLLHGEVPVLDALRELTAPLYVLLRRQGTTLAAVTLDEWSSPWLRKPLVELGYQSMVEVVGYEKDHFDRPAVGNRAVAIRRAEPSDLGAVLALDAACFPLPWVKGAEIFEPAIASSPCFLIAAFGEEPVGYAFVTSHQAGQLFHLVRIAVAPTYQGMGIGIRLLAEIVDFCASRHADVLTLNTQADNYTAQRLYEWFGFVRTGERQTVLGLDLSIQ